MLAERKTIVIANRMYMYMCCCMYFFSCADFQGSVRNGE